MMPFKTIEKYSQLFKVKIRIKVAKMAKLELVMKPSLSVTISTAKSWWTKPNLPTSIQHPTKLTVVTQATTTSLKSQIWRVVPITSSLKAL